MKTIVQLLVAALVLNACVQGGMASWKYYKFKDAIAETARFAGPASADEIKQRVLALAEEHEIDIVPVDVEVHKEGATTRVAAAYADYIELVPSLYTREHVFDFEVSVRPVRPVTAEDLK